MSTEFPMVEYVDITAVPERYGEWGFYRAIVEALRSMPLGKAVRIGMTDLKAQRRVYYGVMQRARYQGIRISGRHHEDGIYFYRVAFVISDGPVVADEMARLSAKGASDETKSPDSLGI